MMPMPVRKFVNSRFKENELGQTVFYNGRKGYIIPDVMFEADLKKFLMRCSWVLSFASILALIYWKLGLLILIPAAFYTGIALKRRIKGLAGTGKLSVKEAGLMNINATRKITLWVFLILYILTTGLICIILLGNGRSGLWSVPIMLVVFGSGACLFAYMLKLKYSQERRRPEGIHPR